MTILHNKKCKGFPNNCLLVLLLDPIFILQIITLIGLACILVDFVLNALKHTKFCCSYLIKILFL